MIFNIDEHGSKRIALIDADTSYTMTYGSLVHRIRKIAEFFDAHDVGFVVLLASNTLDSVCAYLACLDSVRPLALVEDSGSGMSEAVMNAYQPRHLLSFSDHENGYRSLGTLPDSALYLHLCDSFEVAATHPSLALLLPTSGSTGSPKFVRLSRKNVEINAASIAEYLRIKNEDCAIQSLPAHYSYGLSVLNSHLVSGASVVLTSHSFLQGGFWDAFRQWNCNSFAGVPFMYETLARLRFQPSKYESLRYMTQAGGRLKPDLIRHFEQRCRESGRQFFVMYGQTEATARISYVPCEALEKKCGSVGVAIPGGKLRIQPIEGIANGGELIYEGSNVMMGYAESRSCLSLGDEMGGVLATGDLGYADEDGYFYIVGRLKRFAKLYGSRVSLDDVEAYLESSYPLTVIARENDGKLELIYAEHEAIDAALMKSSLARYLTVPPDTCMFRMIEKIPVTSSGKKDYRNPDL